MDISTFSKGGKVKLYKTYAGKASPVTDMLKKQGATVRTARVTVSKPKAAKPKATTKL